MMKNEKPRNNYKQIYVFSQDWIPGKVCVGETTYKDVNDRIKEEVANKGMPGGHSRPYVLEWFGDAIRDDGTYFGDTEVHGKLESMGIYRERSDSGRKTEWFETSPEVVKSVYLSIKTGKETNVGVTQDFKMRPEQRRAVEAASNYFKTTDEKPAKFLFNAKMRFGKCFTTYQLAKEMNWSRILILTYKPAVRSSWKDDLKSHIDFQEWQFVSREEDNCETYDKTKPVAAFGSLMDFHGTDSNGNIKEHNRWAYDIDWDCIIFDEYHFGAWKEKTKELVDDVDGTEFTGDLDDIKVALKTSRFLYLSGTPFRALANNEFSEEQIFNWTYSDEQKAKQNWNPVMGKNPYEMMPQMVMMTYKLPESISKVALTSGYNEFDLNEFFKASSENESTAKFKYEAEVSRFLKFITGDYIEELVKDKSVEKSVIVPYEKITSIDMTISGKKEQINLHKLTQHSVWLLPNVASCCAMKNLLKKEPCFKGYKIILCAGKACGNGADALIPVNTGMAPNPRDTYTITLTCGKLMTGVTVKPWTSIFMLSSCKAPETYFQSAFRIQSPWTDGSEILKDYCFVFDFAPNRALSQITQYCDKQNASENRDSEDVVEDFIKFLPVLAYSGFSMENVDAAGVIDIAMNNLTSSQLVKGWKNPELVTLNDDLVERILNDERMFEIINKIESWRSSENTKEKISINITAELQELNTKAKHEGLTEEEIDKRNKLKEEKTEINRWKRELKKKLEAFLTKIPVFIYLTDDRRAAKLETIIYPHEPELFKKVVGISHKEFEQLKEAGVINAPLMNKLVYSFRRYELDSLGYTGIEKHFNEDVGGYDESQTEIDFLTEKS